MTKIILILVAQALLFSLASHAVLIKTRVIDGKIVSFDKEKIVVRDSKNKDWQISRSIIKKNYKLLTGEKFHAVFNENEVSPVEK